MAEFLKYQVGLGHVGSYQVSSRPFLTSSLAVTGSGGTPLSISFETVTKFITVTNTIAASDPPAPLRFGFSANGVKGAPNNNYIVLDNGESYSADFKVTSVFLRGDTTTNCSASIIAGLTGISQASLATNWTGSAGIG